MVVSHLLVCDEPEDNNLADSRYHFKILVITSIGFFTDS